MSEQKQTIEQPHEDDDESGVANDPGYGRRDVSGQDLVYVFPTTMAAQLEQQARALKRLAKLTRLGQSLPASVVPVRDGGNNGGERGRLLDIVERQAQDIGVALMHVRVKMTRDELLMEM